MYHIRNTFNKDESNGKFTIVFPKLEEAYLFNKFGLHLHTLNLNTGKIIFNFTYNGNSLYGKLTSVTDQNDVILSIKRNFHGRVEFLQTKKSQIKIKLNNFDMIKNFSTNTSKKTISLSYLENSGLLKSKTEYNGKTTLYNYQKYGKIEQIIEPDKSVTDITYSLNATGMITKLYKGAFNNKLWITNSKGIFFYKSNFLFLFRKTQGPQKSTKAGQTNVFTVVKMIYFSPFRYWQVPLYF